MQFKRYLLTSVFATLPLIPIFSYGASSFLPVVPTTASNSDFLARQNLRIPGADPAAVFERTADDLKSVFEKYRPALDSGTRIITPLKIDGSRSRPHLSITLEKCVLFVCRTVTMDADISFEELNQPRLQSGPFNTRCSRDFIMTIDLKRSSRDLSDVYDRIDTQICFLKNTLQLSAEAHHAASYESGMVQEEIFKLLKKQIQPITRAIDETLKENVQ